MQEQDGLNPADQEFEAALSSLAPTSMQIDPVAAAYAAGRRSVRRQVRVWQSAVAAMLVVSAGMWMTPGQPESTTPFAGRSRHAIPTETAPFASQSFAALQAAVREHGLDGLPDIELPAAQLTRTDVRL